MRWLALAAALMASAACGDDDKPADPDASTIIDANDTDAPPAVTFTSFVIDQVMNQTSATTDPKPYADFETLPDPDKDNPNAYEALFP